MSFKYANYVACSGFLFALLPFKGTTLISGCHLLFVCKDICSYFQYHDFPIYVIIAQK